MFLHEGFVCWMLLRGAWTLTEELVKGTWCEAWVGQKNKTVFLIFNSIKST